MFVAALGFLRCTVSRSVSVMGRGHCLEGVRERAPRVTTSATSAAARLIRPSIAIVDGSCRSAPSVDAFAVGREAGADGGNCAESLAMLNGRMPTP